MSILGKRPMPTQAQPDKGASFGSYPLIAPAGSSVSQPAKLQKVAASDGVARGIRMEPVWNGLDSATPMLNSKPHWSPSPALEMKLPSGSKVVFKEDEGSAPEWLADSPTVIPVSVRRWDSSQAMTTRSLGLFSALFIRRATENECAMDNGSTHDMIGLSMLNWRLRREIAAYRQDNVYDVAVKKSSPSAAVVDWFVNRYSLWGSLVKVKLDAGSENKGRPIAGTIVDGPAPVINYWKADNLQNGDFVGFALVRRPERASMAGEYRDIVRELQSIHESSRPADWAEPLKVPVGDSVPRSEGEIKGTVVHVAGALFAVSVKNADGTNKFYWLWTQNKQPAGVDMNREYPMVIEGGKIARLGVFRVVSDPLQRYEPTVANIEHDAKIDRHHDILGTAKIVGKPIHGALFNRVRQLLNRKDRLDRKTEAPQMHDWLVEPWSSRSAAGPGDNFAAGVGWSGHIMRLGRVKSGAGQQRVGVASHLTAFSGAPIVRSGVGGADASVMRAVFPSADDLDTFDKDIQQLKHIQIIMHRF